MQDDSNQVDVRGRSHRTSAGPPRLRCESDSVTIALRPFDPSESRGASSRSCDHAAASAGRR